MNNCKDCINKKPEQTIEKCPECNQQTLIVKNGSATCTNCGFGWATSPVMAPCVTSEKYEIYVNGSNKENYLLIARLFCVNVNAVKNAFDKGESLSIKGYTYKIREIMLALEERKIEYKVEPNILYDFPEIKECMCFPGWRTAD